MTVSETWLRLRYEVFGARGVLARHWRHWVERGRRAIGRGEGKECPRCHDRVVPVFHGFPTGDAVHLAERREAILAGCMIFVIDGMPVGPDEQCRHCGWSPATEFSHGLFDDLDAPLSARSEA